MQAERFYFENNLREFYSPLRKVYGPRSKSTHQIHSKEGQLLTTHEEIKDRWVEHFSDLLNIETVADHKFIEELAQMPVDESLDVPFTPDELDKAIKNTKVRPPGVARVDFDGFLM